MNLPARVSIAAMFVLGLLGGTLVVAYSGFETSPRRGGTPVFVPAPEAYFIAAIMYAMSCLAMLALLRNRNRSRALSAAAILAYPVLAWIFVQAVGALR
ncbi:MAG: hypothetical protein KF800_14825 [Lysobacter sp.]|nr:hypothetical protein [Lysobacter sp.]